MRLQLAEPVTLTLAAAVKAGTMVAGFMKSPKGQAILKSAGAIFSASPQAEQNRYNATLAEVRTNLGLNQGMTLDKAVTTLEQIPGLISEAQTKAAAGNIGEKRVMARYIKAFEQIANETMAWVEKSYPAQPGSPSGKPSTGFAPPNITTPPANANPAFPGSPGTAKPWYQNPVILLGGGLLAFFILKRK